MGCNYGTVLNLDRNRLLFEHVKSQNSNALSVLVMNLNRDYLKKEIYLALRMVIPSKDF